MQEKNRNHRPQGAGQPPHHMIYTWWTPPKKAMAIRQWRIIPSRSNLITGVIDAALSPAIAKIVIPAQETMLLKTKTTLPSKALSKPDRRMGKLALVNRLQTKTWRIVITFHPPRMR